MDKKQYTSRFKMQGGRYGEGEYDLEARFELTDEEFNEAIDALDEDDRFSSSLPNAMYEAIWDVAEEQLYEDAADYQLEELSDIDDIIPGWEDMTTEELVQVIRHNSDLRDELFDFDCVADLIYEISYPEELTPND